MAVSVAFIGAVQRAEAQSTWIGVGAPGDYNTDGNWNPATAPVAAGDTAIFSATGVTDVNVSAPIGPTNWIFNTDALSFSIAGSDVTFFNFGAGSGIVNNATGNGQTITIANNIGEFILPVQVQQLGNSTLILSGNNSYSGGTVIAAGTLQVTNANSIGLTSSNLIFSGGTFQVDGSSNLTFFNDIVVNTPGGTIDNNGTTLSLGGNISNGTATPGELRFIDGSNVSPFPYTGLTIIGGDNSGFSGGIRIVETNVRAESAAALGAGPVTLDGGTFLAGDTMAVSNTFRLVDNANANVNIIDNNGNVLTIAGKIVDADPLHPGAVEFADASFGSGLTILTNQSTYTGGTFVCSCTTLQLGTTTTAGGIVGAVTVEGILNVVNSDTTGITSITNQFGGVTNFRVSSTASAMTINNDTGGQTNFLNSSTAGNATINNILGGGGTIKFNTFSNGGTATINNAGGEVFFNDRTTLASGHINNTDGGLVVFASQSSAGGPLATIVNSGDGGGFLPSEVRFNDRSTAGNATITNSDGAVLDFNSRASAGTATIINSSVNGAWFYDQSSAANAFITTNAGAGTFFSDRSDGAAAQFLTNAGGTVDFSQTRGPNTDRKITAGSIAGAGDYYLGGNQLTVGSNNLSTEVSGTINDGVSPLLQVLACGCGLTFKTGASLVKVGTGTLILSGANTYTGGTTISGGTLQLGNGGTTGSILGDVVDNGVFAFSHSGTFGFAGLISGSGQVTQLGPGTLVLSGANSYSGGTTVAGGVLSIGANNNIGTGPLALLNGTGLSFSNSFTFAHPVTVAGDPTFDTATGLTVTMAGVIADGALPGDLVKTGGGSLVLAAANVYTGGTVINGGILQLGAGGSLAPTGALTVNTGGTFDLNGRIQTVGDFSGAGAVTLGGGALTAGTGNSTVFSGVMSGAGAFTKAGSGTLTLSGTNTYTGATTVNGGTLSVNGSIASSSGLDVNSGATVGGTGMLPTSRINAGGTLSPGNSIGTIGVAGNLLFSPTSLYLVEVSPTAADRTNVTGAATLKGAVQAVFGPGSYSQRSYTILSAAGGLNGTFDTLSTVNTPTYFSGSLGYTPTDVTLNLSLGLGQAPGLNANQASVGSAIDRAFNFGSGLVSDFFALLELPASSLPGALSQLSGEVATGIAPAGLEAQNRFLMLMLDPFAGVGEASAPTAMRAIGFATDGTDEPDDVLAYGKKKQAAPIFLKAPAVAPASSPQWSTWAATYGSQSRAAGDAATGSHDRDVRTGNIASGFDYHFSPDITAGVALSGGTANFGLSDNLGSGHGDIYQVGAYGALRRDSFYLAASLAVSRFEVSQSRTVAIPGAFSALSSSTAAHGLGARFEAGKRYDYAASGITPFVALQAQSVWTPAFNELANTGSSAFALNYAAQTTTRTRSEIGVGIDRRLGDVAGGGVIGFGRAAWGHEFNRDANINPAFAALSGAAFSIQGAQAAANSALLSAGLLWANTSGWSVRLKGDGEFARSVTTWAGNATVRYMW